MGEWTTNEAADGTVNFVEYFGGDAITVKQIVAT